MTVKVTARDLVVLPTGLLPIAKSQMRIDWAYDDAFLQSVIARAIARIEQTNGVTINPTTVEWTPKGSEFVLNAATVPTVPVRQIEVVTDDQPPQTVTANYDFALKWDEIHGIPIQVLLGPGRDGLKVTLTVGYADVASLPPAVQDLILRHAAHLYEHREILIPGREYVAPDLTIDATWWMPRA